MNLRRGIEVENIWKISFAQAFLRVALVVRFKVLQQFHQNIDSIEYGPYRFEMASWRKLEFDVVQIWFSFRQILPQGCVKCAKQRRTTQTWTAQTVKHKTWSSFNCCSDNRLAQYMHRAPKVKRWIVCHIRCLHWKIEFICCDERNPDAKWKHVKYVFFLVFFPTLRFDIGTYFKQIVFACECVFLFLVSHETAMSAKFRIWRAQCHHRQSA